MRSPEKLRILLTMPASSGGIGRHVRMLADGLIARDHEVTVCAPGSTLARFEFSTGGVVVQPIEAASARPDVVRRLRALARQHDIVHAHGLRAGAVAAGSVAGTAVTAALVVTWHNAPLGNAARRSAHGLIERFSARRSDVVLGASEDLVVRAQRAGARRAMFVPVVAPIRASAVATALQPPARPRTVVSIARLHPQKRIDLLIEATAGWSEDDVRVLVIGDGPLAGQLQHQARARRAPMSFLGERDDVSALLSTADVVVLASDWEARPLVAQEALAAGVPLVATDVGGVRGLVGDAGVLVPAGDANALATAIRQVLDDAALAARLRAAGVARAATWPTAEDMLEQLIAIYRDLAG